MEAFLAQHALQLVQNGGRMPLTHENVAAAAKVSARTLYRYFPAQRDLVAAVWRHLRDSTGTVWPDSQESILPRIRELYAQFERNDALTRAVIAAGPSVNISEHGSVEGRAAFRGALASQLNGLSPEAGDQLVASCVAIYSAPFWQMLRDRGQLAPAAAAEAACFAMNALLAATADVIRSDGV